MHLQMELSMPLSGDGYKRCVTGQECQIVAIDAIRMMIEQMMDGELQSRMRKHWKKHGEKSDRRNGYYERSLLSMSLRSRNRAMTRRFDEQGRFCHIPFGNLQRMGEVFRRQR